MKTRKYSRSLFPDDPEMVAGLSKRVIASVESLAKGGIDDRGAVFTRPHVVDFILDLAGISPEADLCKSRILEPSFGDGDFLIPIALRVLEARTRHSSTIESLANCIRAVELNEASFNATRDKLQSILRHHDLSPNESKTVLSKWLSRGDFLLTKFDEQFNFIVGNPPYVRQERIPEDLLAEYRRRFTTIYDRADLYIPFIEHCLQMLEKKGQLVFICADRWMKNKYGGPLRSLISSEYCFKAHVEVCHSEAFHSDVTAYPAITVITREEQVPTRVVSAKGFDPKDLTKLAGELRRRKLAGHVSVEETVSRRE